MKFITKMTPVAAALAIAFTAPVQAIDYEVWVSDQSNSVAGAGGLGLDGSYMSIFEGSDVEAYVAGTGGAPSEIACNGGATPGPCDVHAIFPSTLTEVDDTGLATGQTLADVGLARLHGALPDPQHKYVNMNFFAPGLGLVGIMTADTKEAVALFRVTGTNAGRSNHMSFWSADGSSLFIANLHGRILERIDTTRDEHGTITAVTFNQSASMGTGANAIADSAKAYTGTNGAGNAMLGTVSGTYTAEATGLFTPNGDCRQNGCDGGASDAALGGRNANVIVCPISSSNDKVYITFGGGGLLVADGAATPMEIVGEYSKQIINGAGCGGVEAGGNVYLNAGASAAGGGATQSEFTMYRLPTAFPDAGSAYPANFPRPRTIFKDAGNTATGGATSGAPSNGTGQEIGVSTRRDAHGMVATTSGHYVHNVDRVQNTTVVYNTATGANSEYDMNNGVCASVAEVDASIPASQQDDVAPDLMDRSPNGDLLFFAARGPAPVTVKHSAQGTCPGVGVIAVKDGGASGELVNVIRTSNTVDNTAASPASNGGYSFLGAERSDPHGVSVVIK